VGKATKISEIDHLPMMHAQLLNRTAQTHGFARNRISLFVIIGNAGFRTLVQASGVDTPSASRRTQIIKAPVAGDRREPSPKGAALRVESMGLRPRAQERLLHQFVGHTAIADDADNPATDECAMLIVKFSECGLPPGLGARSVS
jgi:hypothetical protein